MNPISSIIIPVLTYAGTPPNTFGQNGQMCIDSTNDLLYGPKTTGNWGTGIILADYASINQQKVQSVTATGVTTAINLNSGHMVKLTLQSDTTINFTNPPASGYVYNVILIVIQDSTGSRAISGFQISGTAETPKYPGGAAPSLTGTANSRDDLHVIIENSDLTVKMAGENMS